MLEGQKQGEALKQKLFGLYGRGGETISSDLVCSTFGTSRGDLMCCSFCAKVYHTTCIHSSLTVERATDHLALGGELFCPNCCELFIGSTEFGKDSRVMEETNSVDADDDESSDESPPPPPAKPSKRRRDAGVSKRSTTRSVSPGEEPNAPEESSCAWPQRSCTIKLRRKHLARARRRNPYQLVEISDWGDVWNDFDPEYKFKKPVRSPVAHALNVGLESNRQLY